METRGLSCLHPGVLRSVLYLVSVITAGSVPASTATYEYDVHGRLKSATHNDSTSVSYVLDAAGNRTGITFYVDLSAPTVPTGLTAAAQSATRINLSWVASSDVGRAGVTGYDIYRNGSFLASTGNVTSYADLLVVGSSTYTYRIAAYDLRGNTSAQSAPVTASTPDVTPPTAPSGLSATAVAWNRINLSWTGSADSGGSGLAGYQIHRGGALIGTSTAASYVDTSVAGGTNYSYVVRAYDNASPANVSAASNTANATTPPAPDTTPPSVPTGLGATPVSSTQVNLSWSPSTDVGGSGLAGYRVHRNGSFLSNSPTNSYVDASVVGTTSYSYSVRAYDNALNESTLSSTVSVTTPDTIAPTTPTGLGGSAVSSTQINLSWSASSDSGGSGLAGYRIYRGGSQVATTSATSYSDMTAAPGSTYSYAVAAYDNATPINTSALSVPISVTTPHLIAIGDETYSQQSSSGAMATYQFASSGDIVRSSSSSGVPNLDIGDWLTPKSGAGGFETMATLISGSHCVGTFGSWFNLGSSVSWSARVGNATALTIGTCRFRVDIRNVSTSVIVDSATIDLTAVDTP